MTHVYTPILYYFSFHFNIILHTMICFLTGIFLSCLTTKTLYGFSIRATCFQSHKLSGFLCFVTRPYILLRVLCLEAVATTCNKIFSGRQPPRSIKMFQGFRYRLCPHMQGATKQHIETAQSFRFHIANTT